MAEIGDGHRLTDGYVRRHLPPAANAALEIAILDISQDFLLAYLHEHSVFEELVVFKGGTALRKLFAGASGRFSTDLDFAARTLNESSEAIAALIADSIPPRIGPFEFETTFRRSRWSVTVRSEFGDPSIPIKLDVGPPPWLEPEIRAFVEGGTHRRYGFQLPGIPAMRLEEVLAEKVARLNRLSTARDAWDLVWATSTPPFSGFSRDLVRRLAVLKVWVDNHGLAGRWAPAIGPQAFDPEVWLRERDDWDDEQIGLLATPQPQLRDLNRDMSDRFSWLRELDVNEYALAAARAGDRGQLLAAVRALDGLAVDPAALY